MTVRQAKAGEQVGTLRHTDIFGGVCDDALTLKQVTKERLVTVSAGAKSNRDVCNQAPHTVTLTPVGDDLVYESTARTRGGRKPGCRGSSECSRAPPGRCPSPGTH
ncbi:hypothetical protein AB0D65_14990 [Streptomyces griseoloalbus]|uniref:Uncharacterized protein n=1 Tax=Streptomyces griseoloalbus TaxID=67303 RepID=A0ABV3E6M8_9ACTN